MWIHDAVVNTGKSPAIKSVTNGKFIHIKDCDADTLFDSILKYNLKREVIDSKVHYTGWDTHGRYVAFGLTVGQAQNFHRRCLRHMQGIVFSYIRRTLPDMDLKITINETGIKLVFPLEVDNTWCRTYYSRLIVEDRDENRWKLLLLSDPFNETNSFANEIKLVDGWGLMRIGICHKTEPNRVTIDQLNHTWHLDDPYHSSNVKVLEHIGRTLTNLNP